MRDEQEDGTLRPMLWIKILLCLGREDDSGGCFPQKGKSGVVNMHPPPDPDPHPHPSPLPHPRRAGRAPPGTLASCLWFSHSDGQFSGKLCHYQGLGGEMTKTLTLLLCF